MSIHEENFGNLKIKKNTDPDANLFQTVIEFKDVIAKTTMSQSEATKYFSTMYKCSEAYSGTMFLLTSIFFLDTPSVATHRFLTQTEHLRPTEQIMDYFLEQTAQINIWLDSPQNADLLFSFNELLVKYHGNMLQTILSEKYAKERAILEKTFYTLGKNKEDKARRMKVLAARHLIDIHNGIHEVLQDKDHKTRENLPYLFALYALSLAKFAGENAVRDGIEIQRGRRNQAKSRTDKQGIIVLRKHFTKQDKKQTDPQLWEALKDAIDDEGSLEIKGYTFEFIPDYVENDIKKGRIKQTDSDGNEYLFSFDVFRKTKSLK